MKLIIVFVAGLSIAVVAGCSLSKSVKPSLSTNPSNGNNAPVVNASPSAPAENVHPDSSAKATPNQPAEIKDDLHTPEKGTEERQAIMDALRGNQNVIFQVNYLKVHNGWAWVDTTPLDKNGRATAEGGANLLHFENGKWRVMNLSKVPEDPDDPMGPDDPSPTYIRNLMKTFPGIPRDILPKATS